MSETTATFDQWALVELMGRQKIAGRVTEQIIAGHAFLRVDVPNADGTRFSRFYSPQAVYCISPVSEQIALGILANNTPAPVSPYDLSALRRDKQIVMGLGDDDDGMVPEEE